ncbi:hypothetical protein [Salipaludibacillus aurantiacus]|uniref:Uncharacterized protein n=1 Tax=Salipaludibacillus aurantiacus TaxID=1601833 RepID=A0A1H9TZW3_9BACI|nr:hypothetical protein [Salipaludibacillus aurantiacus]SES02434.1 hypothetical protein SAMN05518684_106184 [Salipaludibacillus aurantiacus]
MEEEGVTVGYKEIYDELRGVAQSIVKLDHRMQRIEERFDKLDTVDERSREALDKAEDAVADTENLKKEFIAYKKSQAQKEQSDKKLKIAIIGTLLPVVLFLTPILITYYNGG